MKTKYSSKLIGAWKLVSFRVARPRKGLVRWADKVSGLLIYSSSGIMSVAINSNDTSRDSLNHVLFYSGRFRVSKDLIRHFVTNATLRSRIGKTMNRRYVLKGNRLIIESLSPQNYATLVWKRIK